MKTFEQIRRDRDREGLSNPALAERHGVHRRVVRHALVSPVPPAKRAPVDRPAPKLGAYRAVIDAWLVADRDAPRKQRHTARRVWQRLVTEHGAQVSERQVSRYVRERRVALGEVGEAFVPQLRAPGVDGEIDWGEAWVLQGGRRTKVHLFPPAPLLLGRGVRDGVPQQDTAGVPLAGSQRTPWDPAVFYRGSSASSP